MHLLLSVFPALQDYAESQPHNRVLWKYKIYNHYVATIDRPQILVINCRTILKNFPYQNTETQTLRLALYET